MALDLSAVATELLKELAADGTTGYITLERETGGAVDPITGDYTPGTTETFDLVGAVTEVKANTVDGSRIQTGDVIVTVDNAIEPLITDGLYIGGIAYTMIPPIQTVNHAGTVQVYKIQARK